MNNFFKLYFIFEIFKGKLKNEEIEKKSFIIKILFFIKFLQKILKKIKKKKTKFKHHDRTQLLHYSKMFRKKVNDSLVY